MKLPTKKLENTPENVSCLGLGCMGMNCGYGLSNEEDNIELLNRALGLRV